MVQFASHSDYRSRNTTLLDWRNDFSSWNVWAGGIQALTQNMSHCSFVVNFGYKLKRRIFKRCAQATWTMTNKLLKYGLLTVVTIVTVGLIGYITLLSTFNIFETPDKKILSCKCDYEGLREAETYLLEGNAVTNPSIHVSVHLDCNGDKRKDEKLIFTADNSSVDDKGVTISWLTFDTLTIEYKKGLRIFTRLNKVVYPDSTLNVHVNYKELE